EDLLEKLIAKAVHHRHDDDQRGHAEQNADERKSGDDGNKPFLAPGAQIAQRKHPFERRKWARIDLFRHATPFPCWSLMLPSATLHAARASQRKRARLASALLAA